MKKILVAAGALSAALLSTAAIAQMPPPPPQPGWNGQPQPGQPQPGWNGPRGWDRDSFWRGAPPSPRDRIQFLQDRVNRGVADGSLDRREAWRVSHELQNVRQWIGRMHWQDAGRLTPDQDARVQARLDQISRQIHWMNHRGW